MWWLLLRLASDWLVAGLIARAVAADLEAWDTHGPAYMAGILADDDAV